MQLDKLYQRTRLLIGSITLLVIIAMAFTAISSRYLLKSLDDYIVFEQARFQLEEARLHELLFIRDNKIEDARQSIQITTQILSRLDSLQSRIESSYLTQFKKQLQSYQNNLLQYIDNRQQLKIMDGELTGVAVETITAIEQLIELIQNEINNYEKSINNKNERIHNVVDNTKKTYEIAIHIERIGLYIEKLVSQPSEGNLLLLKEGLYMTRRLIEQTTRGIKDPQSLQLITQIEKNFSELEDALLNGDIRLAVENNNIKQIEESGLKSNSLVKKLTIQMTRLHDNQFYVLNQVKNEISNMRNQSNSYITLLDQFNSVQTRFSESRKMAQQLSTAINLETKTVHKELIDKTLSHIKLDNVMGDNNNTSSSQYYSQFIDGISQYQNKLNEYFDLDIQTLTTLKSLSASALGSVEELNEVKASEYDALQDSRLSNRIMGLGGVLIVLMVGALFFILRKSQESIMKLNRKLEQSNKTSLEQLALLEGLFDSIPDFMYSQTPQGIYVNVNKQFEAFSRKPKKDIIGKTDDELFDADIVDKLSKDNHIVLEEKQTVQYEVSTDNHGQKIIAEVTKRPILNKQGEVHLILGVARDISAQREYEQQLTEAKHSADAANQAKSDFLANMSHEIRTPMNAIIGMGHLLNESQLTARQQNYLDKLSSSAEQLLGVINDILDFSKIEAGKLDIESTDFQLEDVLDSLANMISLKAEEKDIEVHFVLPKSIPTSLVGDPLRVGQILINLGNNAVKFTGQGGEILLSVEVQEETEQEVSLLFKLKDTGIGMSEQQQKKLFKAFSQADTSTTRKYGGTGLGLSICKQLVSLMQGDIWVESTEGVGSTFIFTLRFGKQAQAYSRRTTLEQYHFDYRALVVDDSQVSRDIFSSVLSDFGMNVDVARDGQQGLQLVEQAHQNNAPYELILLDWNMPILDGISMAKAIEENTAISVKPMIIMVTAYGKEHLLEEAEKVGVDNVLSKPITPSTLLNAIQTASGAEAVLKVARTASQDDHDLIQAKQHLSGAYVLLVEDNEINQEIAVEILQAQNIKVDVANHGAEALQAVNTHHYDGILMDCQMPVMDGYEATRRLREDPDLNQLAIIAMTANAKQEDKQLALESGMNDHIAKPIDVAQMFITMAKWITPSTPENEALSLDFEQPKSDVSIIGIDSQVGLNNTQGKTALYHRMLLKFVDSANQFISEFEQAIAKQDVSLAVRLAHTLKGTSATLGALDIASKAEKLEASIADTDSAEWKAQLEQLVPLIQKTTTDIVLQLKSEKPDNTTQPEPLTEDELATLLTQLEHKIATYEADAAELTEELARHFNRGFKYKQLKKLEKHLLNYEFGEAGSCLEELKK